MNLSSIDNVKPEQKLMSDSTADNLHVSPAIGNTNVIGRAGKFGSYLKNDIYNSPKSPFHLSNKNSGRNRNIKLKLFKKQNGRCFYCKCKTVVSKSNKCFQGNEPFNLATIEHVYHRWDIRRALSKETVLACLNCNQKKNIQDHKNVWNGYSYTGNEIKLVELIN